MKKIGMLGPIPPFRGGIARFAADLAVALNGLGHETLIYNLKRQYPQWLFPASGQTDDATHAFPGDQRLLTPYNPLTWQPTLDAIKADRPDSVIASYFLPWFAPSYTYLMKRLAKQGIERILLAHNLDFHERWIGGRALTAGLLRHIDKLVVLSGNSFNTLQKLYPDFPPHKVVQGFHPCYESYATLFKMSGENRPLRNTILFFGLIKHYKGLDLLIKAMPDICKALPDIRLIIAGDVYGKKQPYLDLIAANGLQNRIETHFRYVRENEVQSFFERSDLCILPYRSATQSGIIQLSYAFGTPVLAADLEGLTEMVRPGKTGGLFATGDKADLAAKVIDFYTQQPRPDYSHEINAFIADYGWDKLARLILQ